MNRNKASKSAFTLIELLVVVTIIVVLLALLTPALDKALYHTELAVCGTNQHAVAGGVLTYTGDYRRSYPARPLQEENNWEVSCISDPWEAPTTDMRPILGKYMGIKNTLLDPLSDPVDFEVSMPGSWIYVSYNLWFGFKYRGVGAGGSMMKMGQKWSFESDGKRNRFDVLLADVDLIESLTPAVWASHPDNEDGKMSSYTWQDASSVDGGGAGSGTSLLGQTGNLNVTLTYWAMLDTGFERGPIDTNAALQDGSVHRYNRVPWDVAVPGAKANNGTFARVPQFSNADDSENWPDDWVNVPLR